MKPSAEIEAIVRRWLDARARGDAELVASFYSDSEDLWLIGSDEQEWLSGSEGAGLVSKDHWKVLGAHESEILRIHAFEAGTVGWAMVEERRTFPTARSRTLRLTIVLELEGSVWKVVHVHASDPVPNLEVAGVELSRTLSDLVDSFGAEVGKSVGGEVTGTATLMFTDIVDSTPLAISVGESSWVEVIKDHFNMLQGVVEAEGGSVVKTMGDGGMCAFQSGSSALRAAAGIQRAVAAAPNSDLHVRIGVHTGDAMPSEGDYIGLTVAKAARVAAAAEGGQVLVSSTTAGLVNSTEFDFGAPIVALLKGIDGTHELWPLDWS